MYRFGYIVLSLISLLAFCACGDDYVVVSEQEQIQINFNINIGSSSLSETRAQWKDTYISDTATYNENTIEKLKFKVLLFATNADQTLLGQLENLDYRRHANDENHIYEAWGKLNINRSLLTDDKLTFKLVILANYDGDIEGITKLSDLNNLEFDYSNHLAEDVAKGRTFIPMVGVKTCTDVTMKADMTSDIGDIYMLRAMAKVRVMLDRDANENKTIDPGEDFALSSVTLKGFNTKGYLVPTEFESIANTENLEIGGKSFRPYSASKVEESLSLYQESDTTFYAYLPEYDISDGRPMFSVRFDFQKDDDEKEYTFNFDEYEDNQPKNSNDYDIWRNNIYDFTIKKADYDVIVTSGDWTHAFDNEITFDKQ